MRAARSAFRRPVAASPASSRRTDSSRQRAPLESLEEVAVGVAWLEDAEPDVREQVDAAVELLPRRREVRLPKARESYPVFMREVADVHRDLFAAHADLYGDDVRIKIELCLAVTDAEFE